MNDNLSNLPADYPVAKSWDRTDEIKEEIASQGFRTQDAIRESTERIVAALKLQTRAIVWGELFAKFGSPDPKLVAADAMGVIFRSVYGDEGEAELLKGGKG